VNRDEDNGKLQLGLRPDKYESHALALKILRALPRGAIRHLVAEAVLFYAAHHDAIRYSTKFGDKVYPLTEGIPLSEQTRKPGIGSFPKPSAAAQRLPQAVQEPQEDALDAAIGFFDMK
jgi:hypothetical protein